VTPQVCLESNQVTTNFRTWNGQADFYYSPQCVRDAGPSDHRAITSGEACQTTRLGRFPQTFFPRKKLRRSGGHSIALKCWPIEHINFKLEANTATKDNYITMLLVPSSRSSYSLLFIISSTQLISSLPRVFIYPPFLNTFHYGEKHS
jgi:hypothetical protein